MIALSIFGRLLNIIGAIGTMLTVYFYYKIEERYKTIVASLQKEKNRYYQKCVECLEDLESLLDQLSYLREKDKKWMLDELWFELRLYCIEVENYQDLLKKLHYYLNYFEARVRQQRNKHRQSFRRQSLVAEHLQTMGLPVDTRDWSQIKARYRQLMKKISSRPEFESEGSEDIAKNQQCLCRIGKTILPLKKSP